MSSKRVVLIADDPGLARAIDGQLHETLGQSCRATERKSHRAEPLQTMSPRPRKAYPSGEEMPWQVGIFGAGSHGKVVLDILHDMGCTNVAWFDDNEQLWGQEYCGQLILGGLDALQNWDAGAASAIVAIGANPPRLVVQSKLAKLGVPLMNAIHPSAVVMRTARLGHGNCICAGAIIGTCARLGNGVIVNTGATIDHDSVLEDGVWVAPGVHTAGRVTIQRAACISTGAVLVAGVCIGEGSVVGAGAVVTRDVPPHVLVLGVPARVIKRIDQSFNWQRLISGIAPPTPRIHLRQGTKTVKQNRRVMGVNP